MFPHILLFYLMLACNALRCFDRKLNAAMVVLIFAFGWAWYCSRPYSIDLADVAWAAIFRVREVNIKHWVKAGRHQVLTSRENPSPRPAPYSFLLLHSCPVEWQVLWKFRLQVLDLKSIIWHSNIHQLTNIYCSLIDSNDWGQQS